MSLGALEATVVGTAMPTIITALGGLAHYSWVFAAYLLDVHGDRADLGTPVGSVRPPAASI